MDASRPVVVLRLRGLTSTGATLLDVLSDYASELASKGGRLYLTGLKPEVHEQINRTNRLDLSGPVTLVEATATRGEFTRRAVAESQAWLVGDTEPEPQHDTRERSPSSRSWRCILKKDVPAGLINAVVRSTTPFVTVTFSL